jgi:hypothetical protein
MIESPTATAWYVYGVVAAPAPSIGPVRLIEHDGLAALAREVSLSEFGEDVLPLRLNDPQWLEANALAHEDVLQAFLETGVVPLRFGAIYRDVRDVERMLEARSAFFRDALARLRGHVELGVKAWLVGSPRPTDGSGSAAGGRAYLERRRDELAAARESVQHATAVVRDVHRRLLEVAVDGVVNRPQPRELTGRSDEMILNAAYLVPVGDETLVHTVARLAPDGADAGVELEITGPWPPYNFVPEDEEPSG